MNASKLVLLLGLATAIGCSADASNSAQEVGDDSERHPLGKAEAIGSCLAGDTGDYCGEQSDGPCWCDDLL